MTEMFVENNRVDVTAELSSLITFAIDDISDFSSRQTSFSKTIVLPGTANNNRIFGHIFQAGQANEYDELQPNFGYNFNASKSAACIIFQDNIQTFQGVLRILQINIDRGRVEYEVSVFGTLFALNAALSGLLLENIDFSAYDHTLSDTEIINSWDNTPGSGYYYPLIDHGNYSVNKHDWDYHTFRPALYVKEYIDKMIANAGFRYDSDLFNTSRFKSLIIPYNQKVLTRIATGGTEIYKATDPKIALGSGTNIDWQTVTGSGFTASASPALSGNVTFTFAGASSTNIDISGSINGLFSTPGSGNSITVTITKNGSVVFTTTNTSFSFFSASFFYSSSFNPGDTVRFDIPTSSSFSFQPGGNATFTTSAGTSSPIPVNLGDTVVINECIPKNIRQIDFLVSIVKLFNLYVYEDKFDSTLINFKPYVDFYGADDTDSFNWTYKLDRNSIINLIPMSELNAKKYEFKYKSDSDYWNELYNKRYGQVYGSYIYDTAFEFASQTDSFELIFAPTVLVGYSGEDKIYPTIAKIDNSDSVDRTEEHIDSIIRIMQTKKITGVSSWDLMDDTSVLDSLTDYGYAGHFDDPNTPSNDLNFGATAELFYIITGGDPSPNQFNVYWSPYMAEITNKDSKLMKASFRLTPRDILDLDFSKYIYVDGVLFRLNKITDYNMSKPDKCAVELLKINNVIH